MVAPLHHTDSLPPPTPSLHHSTYTEKENQKKVEFDGAVATVLPSRGMYHQKAVKDLNYNGNVTSTLLLSIINPKYNSIHIPSPTPDVYSTLEISFTYWLFPRGQGRRKALDSQDSCLVSTVLVGGVIGFL